MKDGGKKTFKAVIIAQVMGLFLFLGLAAYGQDISEPMISHGDLPEPAINGPRVVGTTPGRPFLFLIPATGDKPLSYSAKGLPAGLTLDPDTGIISGVVQKEGSHQVEIIVSNRRATAKRTLTIIAGTHKLAQTPPMGWNSWNVWGLSVSADKVKAAAEAMVDSGLAAHGYQYINIDDGWEKGHDTSPMAISNLKALVNRGWDRGRGPGGYIITNDKFPDMKALADYVHARGLKLGIYSSPGPQTCGRYEGSYGFEKQDAESYARWGIDYLKYDWCLYTVTTTGIRLDDYQAPYIKMRKILDEVDRDIVYSLCQYGMRKVWTWGENVGGNLWRTTGDINDSWESLSKIGFRQAALAPNAGPGHWNDPDMLVVGKVGWGPTLHETKLNKTEQMTHITMWAMLAAPLLIGCDMSNLDRFTLDLLTNDEVIDVDQDPLGKQAQSKLSSAESEIWARPLWDGTLAVALFNKTAQAATVTVKWSDLGLSGTQPVRDLWQRKELGSFDREFSATVLPHGAVMVKAGRPAP